MFEKKEYIVSSTFGICKVEKITKLVVGKEQQMEYYVLQSGADPTKKSYIPVEHHETVLRYPVSEQEAQELLDKMVINTNKEEKEPLLTLQEAKEILESGEPEKWAKASGYYLSEGEDCDWQLQAILAKIWDNLRGELAFSLKKSQDDIRQMVANKLK